MRRHAEQAYLSKDGITSPTEDISYRQAVEEFDYLWDVDRGQSKARMDELIKLIDRYEQNFEPAVNT